MIVCKKYLNSYSITVEGYEEITKMESYITLMKIFESLFYSFSNDYTGRLSFIKILDQYDIQTGLLRRIKTFLGI